MTIVILCDECKKEIEDEVVEVKQHFCKKCVEELEKKVIENKKLPPTVDDKISVINGQP